MVQDGGMAKGYEYWLFELMIEDRKRTGLVLRDTDSGVFQDIRRRSWKVWASSGM